MATGKFGRLAQRVHSRRLAGWITTHNKKVAARAKATRARKAAKKAAGAGRATRTRRRR